MSDETIRDSGKAARDIAARTPEADNDYEIEVHAAACWLEAAGEGDAIFRTHYSGGSTLWQTDDGMTTVRRKVDWLQLSQETAAKRLAETRAQVEAPDPELRAAIRDRLFGGAKEGES